MKGEGSSACFLIRLAAFFSFGVIKACFFPSLFECWDLDMTFLLVVDKALSERNKAEPAGADQVTLINPENQGLLRSFKYGRVMQ